MFGKSESETSPDLELFTVFDSKVGTYRDPVYAVNRLDMIRGVESFYRNPANQNDQLFTNAEDFQVFKIAAYWRKSATLKTQQHEHIANLHEIKSMVLRSLNAETGIVPT